MNSNYILFEDDNKISIDKEQTEKSLKTKLDEIKKWYDLERKVLEEKQRILKLMFDDLYRHRKIKEKEVYES
jgi:hypothetical protein